MLRFRSFDRIVSYFLVHDSTNLEPRFIFLILAIEDVSCIIYTVLVHFFSVSPKTGFNKSNLDRLKTFVLNLKPNIAL